MYIKIVCTYQNDLKRNAHLNVYIKIIAIHLHEIMMSWSAMSQPTFLQYWILLYYCYPSAATSTVLLGWNVGVCRLQPYKPQLFWNSIPNHTHNGAAVLLCGLQLPKQF